MNVKGLLVLGMLLIAIYPAAAVVVVPLNPPAPSAPPTCNSMMSATAYNASSSAFTLREEAHTLLDQAEGQGLNVSGIADSIAEADALLEKAQEIAWANPIPSNNMAIEAISIYESAISDLEALLG
jgi:hypothetical protein